MNRQPVIDIKIVFPKQAPAVEFWKAAKWTMMQMLVVGVGVWTGSAAMQWLGFIVWFLGLIALSVAQGGRNEGLTIDEARKRLDEIEQEAKGDKA